MTTAGFTRVTRTGRRAAAAAVLAAVCLVAGGCTSLPGDSSPQVVRSFSPAPSTEEEIAPTPGQEPDLLLRDFFTASGKPTQKHQAARAFLTPSVAERWDDSAATLILDRIDLNAEPGASEDNISYVVRGTVVGKLETGGVFTPENASYEAKMELSRTGGQWRISALPPGVIMERTELRNRYTPQELFFFNPSGRMLVRDRRWVYNGQASLDTALLSLLMEGPQKLLAPGVVNDIPPTGVFAGYEQGVYGFTGFEDLDSDERHRFAAQVVWVLARAGIPGPYRVQLDGTPIDPDHLELSVEDVAEFNPNAQAGTISPLYALKNGSLSTIDGYTVTPVPGPLGQSQQVESADVSSSGGVAAAVISRGSGDSKVSELVLGPVGGPTTKVQEARTLTRPSFEYEATAVWSVVDGRTITRIARSTSTGEMSQIEVDSSVLSGQSPDGPGEPISVLRLSPTGVRVAFIRDGSVWVSTVSRPKPGDRAIANATEIAPALGDTALSLDWLQDGSLVVGTSSPATPVWHVETDGSSLTPLPSGNITAPVVAVAASPSTLYLTDAHAMLQLPAAASAAAFWREVPAVQGTRAVPVVAN
ncbi:MtrAB system accessory lipoprotein LpqB [Corynebacterium mendelii]|uniref:Lipoprotein LpqB n=2 Tax=Corynebacterium mendelii TaxID=2765362 RepID=A0A939E048_9CORY|nr:MtrAB system accessory lipoprotein LpqB [Corynebacterium mendelii]MBN9644469.1 MtrAB system accessory protein LpqB [Corynebacterium mendelii]